MYHAPVLARYTAMSALPSPSKSVVHENFLIVKQFHPLLERLSAFPVDSSNTSWNSSGEASLKVGFETSTPSTTETYLYFDISALGIPSTATINWVKIVLKVQAPKPSGLSVSIHKVTTSWAETGGSKVSWSNKPSFDLTSLDDKNVDSDTTQIEFTSTELKDLISGVVDGTITNYEGFYIKRTSFTSMGEAIFYSRWAASHNQPKIYINYSE